MPPHRTNRPAGARAALQWGLLAFVGLQLGLTLAIDLARPLWRDPEFAAKTDRLRACLAENPGRPLVVVLGSSRAALGFRPDVLDAGRDRPVVFNYAFTGAGPVMELVCLHRLLRAGVRPAELVVEVHPALLNLDDRVGEEAWLNPTRMAWPDLLVWRPYLARPATHWRRWLLARLTPAHHHRFPIVSALAPSWLPWGDTRMDGWRRLDRLGWMPYHKEAVSPAEYRDGVAFAREQYRAGLQHYRVTPKAERAMHELLAVCRREGIRVTFLTMPEGSEFRSWYPPEGRAAMEAYLGQLCRESGAAWVDARSWVADELFFDNHHLLGRGAAAFTERFGREALGWPRPEARVDARR
jgi:hypothetical protein